MNKSIQIADVSIHPLDYDQVLEHIEQIVDNKQKAQMVTVNPEMILKAQEEDNFFNILSKSHLNTADGMGILWASYYLSLPTERGWKKHYQLVVSLAHILFKPQKIRQHIPCRITGSDLLPKIIDFSQKKSWKIFFLGASHGVAKKATHYFKKQYPEAHFVGSFAGSADIEFEDEITTMINEAQPDLLFVAYGSPNQEYWIHRNLFKLDSVSLAMGVGGTFDFYAGVIKRSPVFMQKMGLEWLWRLLIQPSRFGRIRKATYDFIRYIYIKKEEAVVK